MSLKIPSFEKELPFYWYIPMHTLKDMFQKRHHKKKFNPSTESNNLRYWSNSTSFFFKKDIL